MLENFQDNFLSIFCIERLGNSMRLAPSAFPCMPEGDISLAFHLSEHLSKIGTGNATYVSCQAFIGKDIKNIKIECKEAKLPTFRSSFVGLGLTGVIKIQQL